MIVTKALLENLFSSFSLPLPDIFEAGSIVGALPPSVSVEGVAYSSALISCAGISISSADLAPAFFRDDGMAHSFDIFVPDRGGSGNGWVGVEIVLIRLDSDYVSNGTFPVWSVDPEVSTSRIGYDAVVCVQMHEPWIVQTYNSSLGVPTTMTIVGKSATTDFETDDGNRGPHLDSSTRVLNSTGKYSTYAIWYEGGFSFERY